MKTFRRWHRLGALGMGLALGALTGCQTWFGGTTLPSGHYLQHPPQFIPESPPFPLTRELADMEAQQGPVGPGPGPGPVAPLPPPIAPAP